MDIRQAEARDAGTVVASVNAAFSIYLPRIGKPPGPMLLDFLAQINDQHVWVAQLAGEIMGVLVHYATPEGWYIDTVAVSPPSQGAGLGRHLLAFAEVQARSKGFELVYLCTNAKMTENQVFYPRLGYEEYERKVAEGYDRIYYRKFLA